MMGPEEIEDLGPKECYIDYKDVENFDSLLIELENLSPEVFLHKQQAMRKYLNGDAFLSLKPESTLARLADLVE